MARPRSPYFRPEDHDAIALAEPDTNLDVLMDTPEVGLVTLSYDGGINEWNLEGDGLPKTFIVPEAVFRKAAENYRRT